MKLIIASLCLLLSAHALALGAKADCLKAAKKSGKSFAEAYQSCSVKRETPKK
jgi:hypothetical protein